MNTDKEFLKQIPSIHEDVRFFKRKDNIYYKIKNINNPRPVTEHIWIILQLIDGVNSINQILDKLSKSWKIELKDIVNFFQKAIRLNIITLSEVTSYKPVSLIETNVFPTIFNFVVTEQCNLKCIYCFGNYGESNTKKSIKFFPFNEVEPLFKGMSENGTDAIELTGGEPFLHNKFLEIYKLALKYFKSVSVLSNGVLITDKFYEILKNNIDKTDIQISIDGGTEVSNAIVRKVENTWSKTLYSIERLASMNANLRVIYMLVYDNKDDLINVCDIMANFGVKDFDISIPDSRGRGTTLHLPCGSLTSDVRSEYAMELIGISHDARKKYKNIFKQISVTKIEDVKVRNCGAGWNSVSINCDGDMFACQSLYKSIILGNVLKEDIVTIFENNPVVEFLSNFSKDPISKQCSGCEYKCAVCLYRIITSNIDLLRRGKSLCPIAIEYDLQEKFDFNQLIEFEIANRIHND